MDHYDAVIIGSGQAGNPLAKAFANAGRKTALIERAYIGGSSINYGCTPTKTMFNSARVAYLARRAADYGVHHGDVAVNMAEVRERKQKVVESFRDSGLRGLEQTENVALFWGDAHFTGAHAIEVNQADGQKRRLIAEEIFINTGGRPAIPLIDGLDEVPMLDSTSIMELDDVPDRCLVGSQLCLGVRCLSGGTLRGTDRGGGRRGNGGGCHRTIIRLRWQPKVFMAACG